jgi:hypothetical protein
LPQADPAEAGLRSRFKDDFERALSRLESSPSFSKITHQSQVLARAQKLLKDEDGIAALYTHAARFDPAGVFTGSDWDYPQILEPSLAGSTLRQRGPSATLECLSELRLLAISQRKATHAAIDAEHARRFLEQVLAANLDMLFPVATETARALDSGALERVQSLFGFILSRIGTQAIIAEVLAEVERVLLQRPIMVERAESLLRSAEKGLEQFAGEDTTVRVARHWIGALRGPSVLAQTYSAEAYSSALAECDYESLTAEAGVFGASMNETGLVSAQHADLLRHLVDMAPDLLPLALALNDVGKVSIEAFASQVAEIIQFAIVPQTARSIYGLSRLLNAGTLFSRPVLPGLRRIMLLDIDAEVASELQAGSEWQHPPSANVLLLAGTLSVLGRPRGVDQGFNPTCQSARAISLWAQNDIGYLLELIAYAAREDDMVVQFEAKTLCSSELATGMAKELHTELDTVSLLLTPHIDRLYVEMGRLTIGRPGDGHRWVNPELHGWWVSRGFAQLIDIANGAIHDLDGFARLFYSAYHPLYNGGRDLVYAQPCGIASTDTTGVFLGWHAISIQRVAPDPDGRWRVYFFNPNREKGQNWGQGIVTSTNDADELEGESSLVFEQFLSRLYVFHYKPSELGDPDAVPSELVEPVRELVVNGWGVQFGWSE